MSAAAEGLSGAVADVMVARSQEAQESTPAGASPTSLCFLYGPETITVLREICNDPDIADPVPAQLPGYRRIFVGNSDTWGGATVSLALDPQDDASCAGSVVGLADEALSLLQQELNCMRPFASYRDGLQLNLRPDVGGCRVCRCPSRPQL